MKQFYLFFLSSLFVFSFNAQEIPNGGFEEWVNTIWTYDPMGWSTDNMEATATVIADSAAYSGELCMTIIPDADGLGVGDGYAETTLDISYIPEALEFYARWDYVGGQVGVTITFYNESVEVISENWSPTEFQSVTDWQFIQFPLSQIEPIITHCVVRCYAEVGDLATATISFDDMQFGIIDGVDELSSEMFVVGPNPCRDQLTIQYDKNDLYDSIVSIFDIEGRLVYQNKINSTIDINSLDAGNYIVQVLHEDRVSKKQITVLK